MSWLSSRCRGAFIGLACLGCLFLAGRPVARAQEFKGGFLAGLTSTQLDGDLYSGFNKTGITMGAFVMRDISDRSSMQMELRYFGKGSKEDDTKDGGGTYYKSVINYIELPLLYQYHVKRFVFEVGLSAGVLVKSSEEDINGLIPDEQRVEFRKLEFAGHSGFKYILSPHWAANFRFSYSVLPVRKNFGDQISTTGPEYMSGRYSYNNCISVSLYYQLDTE